MDKSPVKQKKQLAEYKKLFRLFDKNDDGLISLEEFTDMVKKYHLKMTEEEIAREISKYDKDGDLSINFDEFVKIMTNSEITK